MIVASFTEHIGTQFAPLFFYHLKMFFSPLFCHAFHELLFRELALRCCPELPGDEKDAYTGRVQTQVVTELLDPINAYFVVVMRI